MPTQLGKHFWPDFTFISGIRIDYLSPTLYLTDIITFLLFLFTYYKKKIKLSTPHPYILFVLTLVILSVALSQNPLAGIYGLIKLFEMIFVAYYIYKNVNIVFLSKVLSIAIVYQSLIAVTQFINKGSTNLFYLLGERSFNSQTPNIANATIDGSLVLRVYGTFSHPNVLAGFLLTSILLIILYIKPQKTWEKLYFNAVLIIGGVTLIITLSRIPIILFALLIPVFLIRTKRYILLLGLYLLALIPVLPYLSRFLSFSFSDLSFLERKYQMIGAIEMTRDYPLLGVGLNNFLFHFQDYYFVATNYFFLQPVHNIYLLILSQLGFISFVITLYYLVKVVRQGSFNIKVVLLTILFLGFIDHYLLTVQQGQLLLAVLIGVSLRKD